MTIYPTTGRFPDFYIQTRVWWNDETEYPVDDAPSSVRTRLPMAGPAVLVLTYPLNAPFRTVCAESEGGWTFERLAHAVADAYHTVYRDHTAEIWGHGLCELVLEGCFVRNPDRSWTPVIGS